MYSMQHDTTWCIFYNYNDSVYQKPDLYIYNAYQIYVIAHNK